MNQRGYTVMELLVAGVMLVSSVVVVFVTALVIKILWRLAFP